MAKVHYVTCPFCRKDYYIDQILYEAILANPKQKLLCPYCRKEFQQEMKPKTGTE